MTVSNNQLVLDVINHYFSKAQTADTLKRVNANIVSVTKSSKTLKVEGNVTSQLAANDKVVVTYFHIGQMKAAKFTVVSVAVSGTNTNVVVTESVNDVYDSTDRGITFVEPNDTTIGNIYNELLKAKEMAVLSDWLRNSPHSS